LIAIKSRPGFRTPGPRGLRLGLDRYGGLLAFVEKVKTIFKVSLILAAVLAGPDRAGADSGRDTKQALRELFPRSERVSYVQVAPTPAQRAAIEKRLGSKLARSSYYFYVATTGDRVDGYAFVDDEIGQHEPITFAVKLSADGVVERLEVLVYREAWGGEIRDRRFRRQFVGKKLADPLRLHHDIDAVSGATLSSGAMARGVRRALALFDAGVRVRTASSVR
jgi:Na+-translocating ferredoxin:NAD+ oxidoreductase subunit G